MTTTQPKTRASSTPLLRPSTLLLAAAFALEVVGVRVLAPVQIEPVVAAIDGTAVEAPAAPVAPVHRVRTASVEVRVVAQSDLPTR